MTVIQQQDFKEGNPPLDLFEWLRYNLNIEATFSNEGAEIFDTLVLAEDLKLVLEDDGSPSDNAPGAHDAGCAPTIERFKEWIAWCEAQPADKSFVYVSY